MNSFLIVCFKLVDYYINEYFHPLLVRGQMTWKP